MALLLFAQVFPPNYPVFADSTDSPRIDEQIYNLVFDLLYDALSKNTYFNISNIEGKTIYICDPINAHQLVNGSLLVNSDIEYYLIKADSDYIACVTVCYESGNFSSASFSTDIAEALEYYDIGTTPVALVGYNGTLFIKTLSGTVEWHSNISSYSTVNSALNELSESVSSQITSAVCEMGSINTSCILYIDVSTCL